MCVTGNRTADLAIGIGVGALTGGAGFIAAPAAGLATSIGGALGVSTSTLAGSTIAATLGGGILGGIGSLATNLLSPKPQESEPAPTLKPPESQITGSGGERAASVLASEIRRVKKARGGEDISQETPLLNTKIIKQTGLQI